MKNKGIKTLFTALCIGILISCSSDSDMLSDKEILSDTLTKGSWQVSLQHSLTQNALDHADILLTFTYPSQVNVHFRESRAEALSTHDGSYALFYEEDDKPHPDEELEYYYDRHQEGDLFLSFAFGKNDVIILNNRWEVKAFTSSSVTLQRKDITLTLNKVGDNNS